MRLFTSEKEKTFTKSSIRIRTKGLIRRALTVLLAVTVLTTGMPLTAVAEAINDGSPVWNTENIATGSESKEDAGAGSETAEGAATESNGTYEEESQPTIIINDEEVPEGQKLLQDTEVKVIGEGAEEAGEGTETGAQPKAESENTQPTAAEIASPSNAPEATQSNATYETGTLGHIQSLFEALPSDEEISALTERAYIWQVKGDISYIKAYEYIYSSERNLNTKKKNEGTTPTEEELNNILTEEQIAYYNESILPLLNEKAGLCDALLDTSDWDSLSDVVKAALTGVLAPESGEAAAGTAGRAGQSGDMGAGQAAGTEKEALAKAAYEALSADFKAIIAKINALPLTEEEVNHIHLDDSGAGNSEITPLITLVTSTIPSMAAALSEAEQAVYNAAFGAGAENPLTGPSGSLRALYMARRTAIKGEAVSANYEYKRTINAYFVYGNRDIANIESDYPYVKSLTVDGTNYTASEAHQKAVDSNTTLLYSRSGYTDGTSQLTSAQMIGYAYIELSIKDNEVALPYWYMSIVKESSLNENCNFEIESRGTPLNGKVSFTVPEDTATTHYEFTGINLVSGTGYGNSSTKVSELKSGNAFNTIRFLEKNKDYLLLLGTETGTSAKSRSVYIDLNIEKYTKVTQPSATQTKSYTGSVVQPDGFANLSYVSGTTLTTQSARGKYTGTYKPTDGYCWADNNGTENRTFTLYIKDTNPISVTASQSGTTTYKTSAQDFTFTQATGAQGTLTYAIQSAKNASGTDKKSSFSLPSTGTLRAAASLVPDTYTVVIRASAAGNDSYYSGYKDITYTLTVNKAANPITAPSALPWTPTFSTSNQTETVNAFTGSQGTLTYSISEVRKSSTSGTVVTTSDYFAISGTTLTLLANVAAGTYCVKVKGSAAGNSNYESGYKEYWVTVNVQKAAVGSRPTTAVTKTYTGKSQTNDYTKPSGVSMTGNASGTNYGTYTATYTPDSNHCWGTAAGGTDSAAVTVTLTINKATLTPSLSKTSYNYNGSEQKPTVSFSDFQNGESFTLDKDYTVTYPSDTKNCGTKTVAVALKSTDRANNYKLSTDSLSYTINQIASTFSVTGKTIYVNQNVNLANGQGVTNGALGTLSYSVKTWPSTVTAEKGSLSGSTYTAGVGAAGTDTNRACVITVTDSGDTNHSSTAKDVTITIQKYTPTLTWKNSSTSTMKVGTTLDSAVTVSTTGTAGAVTYSANKPDYLTVNNTSGLITASHNSSGTQTTITATAASSTTNKKTSVTRNIAVIKGDSTISVTSPQPWSTTYSDNAQTKNITAASGAKGSVTYSITESVKAGTTTAANYFTTTGTNTITMLGGTPVGDYTVTVQAMDNGTDDYDSKPLEITLNVTVSKASVGAKPATSVSKIYTGGTLTNNYTKPAGVTLDSINKYNSGKNVGTYKATYTPDSNHKWSDDTTTAVTVTLTITEATLSVTANKQSYPYMGSPQGAAISASGVDGVSPTIKYGTSAATCNSTTVPQITNVSESKTIYYEVSLANHTTKTGSYVLEITKVNAAADAPAAKTGLAYTGVEQELITASTGVVGGTVYYGLGTSDTAGPSSWSTSIPKATKAGSYYVWYKVEPDGNHNAKTEAYGCTATIAKRGLEIDFVTPPSYIYDKTAKTPEIKVLNLQNGESFTLDTDYSVAYSNNINAGSASVKATLKSNNLTANYVFNSTDDTITFAIAPYDISASAVSVEPIPEHQFEGTYFNPSPVLSAFGGTLAKGTDYNLSAWTNTPPSTEVSGGYSAVQSLTVTGTGNYQGTRTVTYPEKRKAYTVTYEANGGTAAPVPGTKYYEIDYTVSGSAVRTGADFIGWADSAEALEVVTTITANEDVVLYAIWKYDVTLNTNGGTLYKAFNSYTYSSAPILLPGAVNDGTYVEADDEIYMEGYDFAGWCDNAALTGTPLTAIPALSFGAKEYWAKWTPRADIRYTVVQLLQKLDYTQVVYPEITDEEVRAFLAEESNADGGYMTDDSGNNIAWVSVYKNGTAGQTIYPVLVEVKGFDTPLKHKETVQADGSSIFTYSCPRQKYTIEVATEVSEPEYESYASVARYNIQNHFGKWLGHESGKSITIPDVYYGTEFSYESGSKYFFFLKDYVKTKAYSFDYENQVGSLSTGSIWGYKDSIQWYKNNEYFWPAETTIEENDKFLIKITLTKRKYNVAFTDEGSDTEYDNVSAGEQDFGTPYYDIYNALAEDIKPHPTKNPDHSANYTFSGNWVDQNNSDKVSGTMNASDTPTWHVKPVFNKQIKKYSVTFSAWDGVSTDSGNFYFGTSESKQTEITIEIPYGEAFNTDSIPVRESDTFYEYSFLKWTRDPAHPEELTSAISWESLFTDSTDESYQKPTFYAVYAETLKTDRYNLYIESDGSGYGEVSTTVYKQADVGSRLTETVNGEIHSLILQSPAGSEIMSITAHPKQEDNGYKYEFDYWKIQTFDKFNQVTGEFKLRDIYPKQHLIGSNVKATAVFKRTPKTYVVHAYHAECNLHLFDNNWWPNSDNPSYGTPYRKYEYGTEIVLPVPSREGYEFLGWTRTDSTEDKNYITKLSAGEYGDQNIYAKWNTLEDYKLTVNTEAHYGGGFTPESGIGLVEMNPAPDGSGSITENAEYHFRAKLESNDEAYEFEGWYINKKPVSGDKSTTDGEYSILTYAFKDSDVVRDTEGNNPSIALVAKYRYTQDPQGVKLSITGEAPFFVTVGEDDYAAVSKVVEEQTIYVFDDYVAPLSIVTLSYEGEDIPEWINERDAVISSANEYSFKLVVERRLKMAVTEAGELLSSYMVEARNNNQIIKRGLVSSKEELTEFFTDVLIPVKLGKIFSGWGTYNEIPAADVIYDDMSSYASEDAPNRVIFTPLFEDVPEEATVTVISVLEDTSTTRLKEYKYKIGEFVTLSATTYQGLYFKCWAEDAEGTRILASSISYPIHVGGNRTVYAIYGAEKTELIFPTVKATLVQGEVQNSVPYICFQVTRDIPDDENFTLLGHGVLCRVKAYTAGESNSDIEQNIKFIEDAETGNVTTPKKVINYPGSDMDKHNLFTEHLKIGTANAGTTVYLRGYIIYEENGVQHIKYTDVYVMTYNSLCGTENRYAIIPTSTPDPKPEDESEDDPFADDDDDE